MTSQIRAIKVEITPQQRMAFAFRNFPLPEVQAITGPNGTDYLAYTVKDPTRWAEYMARSPEVAVEQLARLITRS